MSTAKEFYYSSVESKSRCSAEAEALIAQEAMYAVAYARDVIKGPFPEAEPVIAQDGIHSMLYAMEVLKKPFPSGEAMIATLSEFKQKQYKTEFENMTKEPNQKGLVFEIDMSELDDLAE